MGHAIERDAGTVTIKRTAKQRKCTTKIATSPSTRPLLETKKDQRCYQPADQLDRQVRSTDH